MDSSPRLLRRLVDVRPDELRALVWSFLYFLFLLTAYYVLRPLRDERGVAAGASKLQWLFTATFVVMLAVAPLWSALVSRVPRGRLLPIVYRFFILNLLLFFVLFHVERMALPVARAFYVWTSVFNLLAVAVFWAFMADVFKQEQGKRLFGFIAAGGSCGAILGPLITSTLVGRIGAANLLLISAGLLECAARAIGKLNRWQGQQTDEGVPAPEKPVEGTPLSGIKVVFSSPYLLAIAGYTLCASLAGTFGYVLQAHLVSAAEMTSAARTALFARMDLAVNVLTLALQAIVAGRLLTRFGPGFVLAMLPPLSTIAFSGLAWRPTLAMANLQQVVRRTLAYGAWVPANHVLFTVVSREQKYKSKAFIETAVYRGGDVASSWAVSQLLAAGMGVSGAALVALPVGVVWLGLALFLGRRHQTMAGAAPNLR